VPTWIITVSDTRTAETDSGGALLAELLERAGTRWSGARSRATSPPRSARRSTRRSRARESPRCCSPAAPASRRATVTPEAIEPRLDRVIPGFGELFRALSYQEIGSAALLSRALGGIAAGRVVLALPGSRAAIALAMEKLVLPELGTWPRRRSRPADARLRRRRVVLARIAGWTAAPDAARAAGRGGELRLGRRGRRHAHHQRSRARARAGARAPARRESLRSIWDGPGGPPLAARRSGPDREEDRTRRALRAAVDDLQRGENARARGAAQHPARAAGRPEPHWYLAQLDRYRGRYDSAAQHLEAFLATAATTSSRGRDPRARGSPRSPTSGASSARRPASAAPGPRSRARTSASSSTPISAAPPPGLRETVLRYLEEARTSVAERLGAQPDEPMGVVFYGRGAYDQAHRDRFSFRTVGFFDGRIHVVSAAHRPRAARAAASTSTPTRCFASAPAAISLLAERGLAELSERESRGQPGLTRSERAQLKRRIDAGEWISLRRLAPSFRRARGRRGARIAYPRSSRGWPTGSASAPTARLRAAP
jgi:molybdenum cofactor biosynthesis protein B